MPSSMDEQERQALSGATAGAAPGASRSAEREDAAPGYETRDANTTGVLAFLGVLATVLALVFLLTWGLFRQFTVSQPSSVFDQNRGPVPAFADVRKLPPGPELQVTPREDLEQLLARQERSLETYGWENRQTGLVRIPIERAMELLQQKGLPQVTAAGAGANQSSPSGELSQTAYARSTPTGGTNTVRANHQIAAATPAGPKGN